MRFGKFYWKSHCKSKFLRLARGNIYLIFIPMSFLSIDRFWGLLGPLCLFPCIVNNQKYNCLRSGMKALGFKTI